MANLTLVPKWRKGIYRIETSDDILAGENGIWNRPQKQLGDRTEWLKAQMEAVVPLIDRVNGEVIEESLADKLDYLIETKRRIRDAIRRKGIAIEDDDPFRVIADYADALTGEGAGTGEGGEPPSFVTLAFESLTADGSETETSTELTLKFSKDIDGLTENNITLSGVAGLVKGELSGSGRVYKLGISGFKRSGTLTVTVMKAGYAIAYYMRTVGIIRAVIDVSFDSLSVDGAASVTSRTLTFTFSEAIDGLEAADITLSGIEGIEKGTLAGDGPTYTLPISGFTEGGPLTVLVEKAGYEIADSPKTVNVFYAVPVTFSGVTQNGSASVTSTTLTLKFDKEIEGLTIDDITLSGVTGIVKGTLSGSGPSYTLGISGFTAGGTLTVAVAKDGFEISNPSRNVTVYYAVAVTFSSVTADGSSSATTTKLTLTFDKAITGLAASDITLSGITGISKGTLSASGSTYTLTVSGFTEGGTLTVSVAKSGYAISNPSRTVTVYKPALALNGVTADGSSTSTSTTLTLNFTEAIPGLAASDITLSGVSGITKGTLTASGASYTLKISGFTAGGTLTVSVAKTGFVINNPSTTVTVYYAVAVTFSSVTADGSSSATTTKLTLTFSAAITGLAASDITLSGVAGIAKGTLSASGSTYTLPVSGLAAGGTLTVAVAKNGYAITNPSRTVTVYKIDLVHSTPEALSFAGYMTDAASVGGYALFGGGDNRVDAYNSSLTRSTLTGHGNEAERATASVGDYALFFGHTLFFAYNSSLTRKTFTAPSPVRQCGAATSIGGYALLGGGGPHGNNSTVVDAYDSSLTRSTPTALSRGRQLLAATPVGGYALFGGGYDDSGYSDVVDAYNSSLTRSTPTKFGTKRDEFDATSVGDYALFGGGYNGGMSAAVDAYNSSLTRSTPTALSQAREHLAATPVGNYALFGGGYDGGESAVVDAYNSSLTRSTPTALSQARFLPAATSVGSYALFAGGANGSAVVDAYAA